MQSVPLPPQNTPILSFIPHLNSPHSSPIYGFQPVSSAPLVTRVRTREYTNTIGFTRLYRAFIYLLTYLFTYQDICSRNVHDLDLVRWICEGCCKYYANRKSIRDFISDGNNRVFCLHRFQDIRCRNVHDLDLDLQNWSRWNKPMPIDSPETDMLFDVNSNFYVICHHFHVYDLDLGL